MEVKLKRSKIVASSTQQSMASISLSDNNNVIKKSDKLDDIKKDIDINDHIITIDELETK